MTLPNQEAAAALERHLGDPRDPRARLSFAAASAADEQEAFPAAQVSALVDWGYLRQMVPLQDGGRLGSFEEAIALQRVVSRRDLTAAIALGQSFLGNFRSWSIDNSHDEAELRHTRRQDDSVALCPPEVYIG